MVLILVEYVDNDSSLGWTTQLKGANLEFWYFMVINALDVNDTDQVIVENEPHVLSYYAVTRFLIYNRFIGAWALCVCVCVCVS